MVKQKGGARLRWGSLRSGPTAAGLCCVVMAVALVLTYRAVLFSDWSTISGRYDVYRYFGPLAFFMDDRLHHGELPLWNPLVYCGLPFTANPQAALWYPPNLLRSLLNFHPAPQGTQVTMVLIMGLHLLLAGLGTYGLARAHRISRAGSYAAAFAFAFSALMVRRACEYHFLTTLGWLPLLLLLVKRGLDASGLSRRLYYALGAGLIFGLSILGGFLQIVTYMALSLFVYGLVYRILHREATAETPEIAGWRRWTNDAAVFVVVAGVGVLTACAMLLPAAELARFSARHPGEAIGLYSSLFGKSPVSFFQGLIVYPGMRYEAETLRGAGVAALLLALAGLTHRRWRATIVFAILYVVLVDCSFGPPLPIASLMNRLTPFSISVYSRAYDLALLPLSLLAGLGVDAVSRPLGSPIRNGIRTLVLGLAGALVLALLARWVSQGLYLPVTNLVVIVPGVALAVMLAAGWTRHGRRMRFLLPLLLLVETLIWNASYVPWLVRKPFSEAPNRFAGAQTFPQVNTRGADPMANRLLFALTPIMNGYDPVHIQRVREVMSAPGRGRAYHRLVEDWEVTKDNQRGNLFLKRSFWLARQYVAGPLPGKEAVFPAATTVFLNDGPGLPVPRIEAKDVPASSVSDQALRVPLKGADTLLVPIRAGKKFSRIVGVNIPRGPAGGRSHSALCLRYTTDCPAAIDTIFTDQQNGRSCWGKHYDVRPTSGRETAVEIPLPDYATIRATITAVPTGNGTFQFTDACVMADQNDEDDLIHVIRRGANTVELNVGEISGHRILTFLDAAYPGWRAFVDGEPVPIYRADDAFKAIVVPPGTHHVRFTFQPRIMYAGLALSLATGIGAIAALVLLRPRKAPPKASPLPARAATATPRPRSRR